VARPDIVNILQCTSAFILEPALLSLLAACRFQQEQFENGKGSSDMSSLLNHGEARALLRGTRRKRHCSGENKIN
jgi:hypothetical protein